MPKKKQAKPPMMVREPVQVYLAQPDRSLLNLVAKKAGVSRAEVLRRGLRRIGADILNDESPMMKLLDTMAAAPSPKGGPTDIATRHDEYLAEAYLDRHDDKKKTPKAR